MIKLYWISLLLAGMNAFFYMSTKDADFIMFSVIHLLACSALHEFDK